VPDLVLDYHRLKTPIDHPDLSVTREKLAFSIVPLVVVNVLTSDVTASANTWTTLLSATITLDVRRAVFVIGMCSGQRSGSGKSYVRLRRGDVVVARGMSYESESTTYAPDWSVLVIAHAEVLDPGTYTYYFDVYPESYAHYFRAATYPDFEGARLIVLAWG
jgi:hypothetical protein